MASEENIKTLSGEFNNCLKFESNIKTDQGEDQCTFWLAKGVGIVKESCLSIESREDGTEESVFTVKELKAAVIDGKKIGFPEEPTTEAQPQEGKN